MVAVKHLGVLYAVTITVAVLSGAYAVAMLYRSGSESVPGWQSVFVPGPLSTQHAFLADDCEACHTPVRGIEAPTCITCHATAAAALAKQSTAFHASIQDCRGCHVEHEGAVRPTRMNHAALARIGYHLSANGRPGVSDQLVEDLATFVGVQTPAASEKSTLNCANCHSNQDPHRQLVGSDCAGCHSTSTWDIATFLHPSPTSRDCAQCHQGPPSHYMEHFKMVSVIVAGQPHAQVNQCYLCHQTNSFNDIKGIGWYKHH